jgi:ketosteroid isomerase-like protein
MPHAGYCCISEPPSPERSSERLARRWFGLVRDGDFDRACELLHEDVVVVSKVRPGEVIEGRDAVAAFIRETIAESLYDAAPDTYVPVDDDRIVVEGRMRWIDDERVIRDDPVLWALEFRDELLFRFVPARTAVEAEALLVASRDDQAK